ncbi:MAG: ATP synthase F1 subunit epsilon [Gemmataceae bacterium]|nr:ATP synthase F1 subunit epsilon [Gemmataceae bacterium]
MNMESATGRQIRCVVVTPETAVLDEHADFVAVPMYDGELGVMHGRSPLIGRLGVGELRLRRGSVNQRVYVDGGFVQIRDNVVTLLTERALMSEQINAEAAAEELRSAVAKVGKTEVEQTEIKKAQARARVKVRVAAKA